MNSKSFALNIKDFINLGKNALLVGVAAGLAWVGQNLAHLDLGPATALVVPIVAVIIDSFVKWAKDNTNEG